MAKKLISCKTCGHEIAKSAKKCPNCGKKRSMFERNPVGAVILIIFCIVIAINLFGSSDSENSGATNVNNASAVTPTPAPTPTPTPEPTFEPIHISISNWEVTVTDFYFSDSVDVSLLTEYQPDENAQFAVVELTAKNVGKEAEVFLPWVSYGSDAEIKLKCGSYTYTRSELFWANDDLTSETLNPLVSASGIVAFNMPLELIESDEPIEMVISADWQSATARLR